MYFEMAARDIRGAAEARGHGAREHGAGPQVHGQLPVRPGRATRRCPTRDDAADDEFLFRQGPARGPRQDPVPRLARGLRRAFADVPNVARFREQAEALRDAARRRRRRARSSSKDLDFLLVARRAVHARRLRAADPRAGGARPGSTPTSSTRSSTCSCATSRPTPSRCTARRRRPRRSRRGRSRQCASRSSTASASRACGRRCGTSPAPTRCPPE